LIEAIQNGKDDVGGGNGVAWTASDADQCFILGDYIRVCGEEFGGD
jgi:hypothetical protein